MCGENGKEDTYQKCELQAQSTHYESSTNS